MRGRCEIVICRIAFGLCNDVLSNMNIGLTGQFQDTQLHHVLLVVLPVMPRSSQITMISLWSNLIFDKTKKKEKKKHIFFYTFSGCEGLTQ